MGPSGYTTEWMMRSPSLSVYGVNTRWILRGFYKHVCARMCVRRG